MMKNKTLLTTLVMLSIMEGSVYADLPVPGVHYDTYMVYNTAIQIDQKGEYFFDKGVEFSLPPNDGNGMALKFSDYMQENKNFIMHIGEAEDKKYDASFIGNDYGLYLWGNTNPDGGSEIEVTIDAEGKDLYFGLLNRKVYDNFQKALNIDADDKLTINANSIDLRNGAFSNMGISDNNIIDINLTGDFDSRDTGSGIHAQNYYVDSNTEVYIDAQNINLIATNAGERSNAGLRTIAKDNGGKSTLAVFLTAKEDISLSGKYGIRTTGSADITLDAGNKISINSSEGNCYSLCLEGKDNEKSTTLKMSSKTIEITSSNVAAYLDDRSKVESNSQNLTISGSLRGLNMTQNSIFTNNSDMVTISSDAIGLYMKGNSVFTNNSNMLTIETTDTLNGYAMKLFEDSFADITAEKAIINGDIASSTTSEVSFKVDNNTIDGAVYAADGGKITFNSQAVDGTGLTRIKQPNYTAVWAYSDEYDNGKAVLSAIDFKQATYINSQNDESYHDNKQNTIATAIYAQNNSVITIDKAVGIYGDIAADCGDGNDSNAAAGIININSINNADFKGNVFAADGGTVNFTLNNAAYEGCADDYTLSGSDGAVNIVLNSSTWTERGLSFVTNVQFGAAGGLIDLSKENNNSVTIGTLNGDGTFKMHLNSADHSVSDMLYIGQNNGTQTINIVGGITGGLENISEDTPLRFATVGEDKVSVLPNVEDIDVRAYTSDAGIFNLEYSVEKEKFDKDDEENKIYNGGSVSESKPGNDFVENELADNLNTAVNWIITGVKEKQESDAGKTVINMSHANYKNAVYMDRLNKRLGEARYIDGDEGMWVRLRHDRIGQQGEFRSMNTMYQLGYDKLHKVYENGKRHVGAAIDYMDGSTSYSDIYGKGESKRWGFWMYDTWLGNKGHYADYVAKFGHMHNDFDIRSMHTGEKITGDYDNNVLSISVEYGRKKDIGNNWYVEPQAQLQLARVTDAEYRTSQGTDVYVDGINSLIGRAGFRLGKDVDERSTVYLKADVLHEFLGDQDISATDKTGTLDKTYENKGTWYDVGFGFATAVGHNSYAYLDFERSFGNDNDETYQINAGLQWSF